MILRRKSLVTVDIFYYMPDYSSILNEFIWQTEDFVPEYPRVHKFLWHWKHEIKATISEVLLCHASESKWIRADFVNKI